MCGVNSAFLLKSEFLLRLQFNPILTGGVSRAVLQIQTENINLVNYPQQKRVTL